VGPNELDIAVALGEDAYEAGFAIEYSLYIGWGDACVDPGGGDGETHDVSWSRVMRVMVLRWVSWSLALLTRSVIFDQLGLDPGGCWRTDMAQWMSGSEVG
jgi:hypothetical protein